MKKLNVLWIVLGSIVFALFNALFFLTDMKDKDPYSTWFTYVFIAISFAVFVLTPYLTGRYTIKRKIFGLLPTEFGAVYFAIQLVLGLVYILSGFESYTPALLVQLFLLAAYAIILIINLIISEKAEGKIKEEYEKKENNPNQWDNPE